jgi:DNA polymerase/3'-5' exonuclease PolX
MAEKAVAKLATIIGHGARGAELARTLVKEGIKTRTDLRKTAVLARLPISARMRVVYNLARNIPHAAASRAARELKKRLSFGAGVRCTVEAVGSIRRAAPYSRDLDFLVLVPPRLASHKEILASAQLRPHRSGDRLEFMETYAQGTKRRGLVVRYTEKTGARPLYCRMDLFLASSEAKAYALMHHTGGRDYNISIRAHAKRLGWRLNQYGLFDRATGHRVAGTAGIRTERALAQFLGVRYRPPRDRSQACTGDSAPKRTRPHTRMHARARQHTHPRTRA